MPTICATKKSSLALGVVLILSATAPAHGGLLASATISTSSTSAPFNYSINLHNIGTTNIGTFWFAWTDVPTNYDFLPSVPTVTGMPSHWTDLITHSNFLPGDGYAIEFYNSSGSGSAIAPGAGGVFTFTSDDTLAIIGGLAFIHPNKVSTSFVYIGFPQTDPGFEFNVSVVPEPSGLVLAGVAGCIGLLTWRRRRRTAIASC